MDAQQTVSAAEKPRQTGRGQKLLIVTAMFPPLTSSGIHRIVRIARYLWETGVEVQVLTVDEKTLPRSFKYDEKILQKIPGAIRVYRIPAVQVLKRLIDLKNRGRTQTAAPDTARPAPATPSNGTVPAHGKSLPQKIKDFITLNLNTPDNYAFWIRPAIKAGARLIREQGIGNILSSSPPGSTHVVAHALKKRTGVNWIADFRDPWAQKRWFNPEMTSYKFRKIRKYERETVRGADTIIMNTPELLADFEQAYGAPFCEKAVAITNGFDPADFAGLPAENRPRSEEIVICHTGTFYRQRSPLPFLHALQAVIRSGAVTASRFRVRLIGGVGSFAAEVAKLAASPELAGRIDIVPSLPHRDCLIETLKADVLLIVQPVTRIQIPAKIYEYIAARKPILAISAEGATSRIVLENNLGWWADFEDARQIEHKLIEIDRFFASDAGRNWEVSEAVLRQFNGKKLVERIQTYLK